MRLVLILLSLRFLLTAASDVEANLFCAVMNPLTGAYIDLSQLSATPNDRSQNSPKEKSGEKSWLVRDGEGKTNFTLSICSSPVASKDDKSQLANTTGAFYAVNNTRYKDNRMLVSIGDFSTKPHLISTSSEARTLTLKYENGSMCPNGIDRKASLLNFICDRTVTSKAQISYIGNLHECAYFFEIRSVYACPTSNSTNEVNVYGIFFSIIIIFFLVEYACRKWLFNKSKSNGSNDLSEGQLRLTPEFTDLRWEMNTPNRGNLWTRLPLAVFNGTYNVISSIYNRATGPRFTPTSTTSSTHFYRDMEHQNEILDNLDNV